MKKRKLVAGTLRLGGARVNRLDSYFRCDGMAHNKLKQPRLWEKTRRRSTLSQVSKKQTQQTTLLCFQASESARKQAVTCVKRKRPRSGQLFLDLGQADFGSKTCPLCGMVFSPGECEDESIHAGFCKKSRKSISFRWSRHSRYMVENFDDENGTAIWIVSAPAQNGVGKPGRALLYLKQKMEEVKKFMDRSMGFCASSISTRDIIAFMYVTTGRLVGCVLVERIRKAYSLLRSSSHRPTERSSALEKSGETKGSLKRLDVCNNQVDGTSSRDFKGGGTKASDRGTQMTLKSSTLPTPATLGLVQLWVSPLWRRQGVASALVDAARKHTVYGHCVARSACAMTQPTRAGQAFGENYFGRPLLVY